MVLRIKKNIDIVSIGLLTGLFSGLSRAMYYQGEDWYMTLLLPALTPTHWVFGVVWSCLYIFFACALTQLVRGYKHTVYYRLVLLLFLLTALLSLAWSYIFFVHQSIPGSLVDCIVIEFLLITIINLTWKDARSIALLVLPIALWIAFALYINYKILVLN